MIHIFDVDNTTVRKTSTWYFFCEAYSKGAICLSRVRRLPLDWIKYKLGRPDMDFIENAVKSIAGIEKNTLDEIAKSCFEHRIKPNIYTGAAKLISNAQNNGEKVIFATSSLYTIIAPLESFFGIEGSIASMLEFSEGKTTGSMIGKSFFGPKKKSETEAWLNKNGFNPNDVCFYSDSYTDIPLLEFSGKPVAVNPDRILKRKAKKQGWEIVRFTETLL